MLGLRKICRQDGKPGRALKGCEGGTTAVEFALIAPVYLMMVMGVVEFSLISFTSSVMEGATNNTARLGKTGYVAAGSTRQDQIVSNVASKTHGLLDPAHITISTEVYSNFNDIGKPEPCIAPPTAPCAGAPGVNFVDINGNGVWDNDMGSAGLGNPGDVVVYTVSYPWPVFTPVIAAIIGSTFTITARTVVRNEPYGNGGVGGS